MQTLLGLDANAYDLHSSNNRSSSILSMHTSKSGSASAQQRFQRVGPRRPCLRRMSAYSGGFKDAHSLAVSRRGRRMKTLTFADKHGLPLIFEKRFSRCEPATECRRDPDVCPVQEEISALSISPPGTAIVADTTPATASRDKTQQQQCSPLEDDEARDRFEASWQLFYSALTQQELLSLCVVSCSFLGCVLVGYRHFVK
ncbi:hypothetical protein Gpo141_00002369 [Globisporangium polare]